MACTILVGLVIGVSTGNLSAQPGSFGPGGPGGPGPGGGIDTSVFEFFTLSIDPKTPVSEIIPALPTVQPGMEPVAAVAPEGVPELSLKEPFTPKTTFGNGLRSTADLVLKIKYLNEKKPDGFVQGLIDHRADLQGLSFAMGKDCQMSTERGTLFRAELDMLRAAGSGIAVKGEAHQHFWQSYELLQAAKDQKTPQKVTPGKKWTNPILTERLGLLMHMMPLFSEGHRKGFVKYLVGTPHPEATRTLAKLALFAQEADVRQMAAQALAVRREKDYSDILLAGLRYPWPEVAKRAAAALVQAERADLAGQLVELLDQPDARLPKLEKVNGKEVYRSKQLVRLNHHQNCLLCHAPLVPGANKLPNWVIIAPVPMPERPLPIFSQQYYNPSKAQFLVRVDVTYLRPDFSVLLKVPADKFWPELQRFDFLVRSVEMNKHQAQTFEAKIQKLNGQESPYQNAVLTALRELTGLDAGATAAEWREALKKAK